MQVKLIPSNVFDSAVGTMVVDYMFSRHLLLNMNSIDGKQLTTMTNALVKSDTIAFVAMKNRFEEFIHVEPGLLDTKPMNEFRAAVASHEVGSVLPRSSSTNCRE